MVAKQVRAAYTQEFRLEAVRLVQSGQSQMQVCQTLGIPKASLGSWVRQVKAGTLKLGVADGASKVRLYLAAVMDMFSRQIVGWSLQPHMQSSLVKDAMAMAWWRRRPEPGAIFHSDRGAQYCSQSFQAALAGWGIRSSMSRKGNCWDNSPIESFWGRLKTACVHGQRFATRGQARQAIMNWMAFYNCRRLHSSLGYLSPMQYEKRWYEAQRKKAA